MEEEEDEDDDDDDEDDDDDSIVCMFNIYTYTHTYIHTYIHTYTVETGYNNIGLYVTSPTASDILWYC
jgi:hypothetical protein